MALTSPSFEVNFNCDSESASFGFYTLVDTTDYVGEGIALADVVGWFIITAPDGTQHIGNVSSPDIEPSVSLENTIIPLPLDANGQVIQGTYTFSYYIRVSGAVQPGDYSNVGNTYNFCPVIVPRSMTEPIEGAAGDIQVEVNCFCLQIEGTDATDVGVPTTDTRVFTLYPPPSLGLPDYTTNSASFTYSFSYTGGYEINLNRLLTYVTGIFTYTVRIDSSVYKNVQCDRDLCALISCLNQYRERTLTRAGEFGGFFNLPKVELDKWIRINSAILAYDNNLKCQNWTEADTIYSELTNLLSCNCSCNEEDDTPRLVNPYCSGGGSNDNIVIVAAGAGITVSAVVVGDTTTYTVAVQQALIDQIAENTTNISDLTTIVNNILAGSVGNNYSLLNNDTTVVGTDANTSEKTLLQYTLPAGQLANDGDYVRLHGYFASPDNTNVKTYRLYFGSAVLPYVPAHVPGFVNGIELIMEVVRTGAATQILFVWAKLYGLPSTFVGYAKMTATETLSGAILCKITGQNGTAAANDILSNRFVVEYFKKT